MIVCQHLSCIPHAVTSFNMVDMTFRETTTSSLELGCTTTGLPATASVWSDTGVLINLNGSDLSYEAEHALVDPTSALYTATLLIQDRSQSDVHGTFVCEMYSSWMTSDQSTAGNESTFQVKAIALC